MVTVSSQEAETTATCESIGLALSVELVIAINSLIVALKATGPGLRSNNTAPSEGHFCSSDSVNNNNNNYEETLSNAVDIVNSLLGITNSIIDFLVRIVQAFLSWKQIRHLLQLRHLLAAVAELADRQLP